MNYWIALAQDWMVWVGVMTCVLVMLVFVVGIPFDMLDWLLDKHRTKRK